MRGAGGGIRLRQIRDRPLPHGPHRGHRRAAVSPDSHILCHGEDILAYGKKQWRQLPRPGAPPSIFQDAMTALNPTMRIGQQICGVLPLSPDDLSRKGGPGAGRRDAGSWWAIPDPQTALAPLSPRVLRRHAPAGGHRLRPWPAGRELADCRRAPPRRWTSPSRPKILELIRRMQEQRRAPRDPPHHPRPGRRWRGLAAAHRRPLRRACVAETGHHRRDILLTARPPLHRWDCKRPRRPDLDEMGGGEAAATPSRARRRS